MVWAVTALLHLLSLPFWARTWEGWLVVTTACLTLMQPWSLPRFTCFLQASLANLFRSLPFVPNHILFEGMVNLTLLTVIVEQTIRYQQVRNVGPAIVSFLQRRWPELAAIAVYLGVLILSQHERVCGVATCIIIPLLYVRKLGETGKTLLNPQIFTQAAPILRWQLILVYVWAVIQKLNWDYLNPSVSAAVRLHEDLAAMLPLLPTGPVAWQMAIWGSLACEAAIPLLLCFAATRTAGLCIAIPFHLLLSLHPHPGIYSFSALIYALLILFFSPAGLIELRQTWRAQRQWISDLLRTSVAPAGFGLTTFGLFFAIVIVYVICYRVFGESRETLMFVNRIGFSVWLLFGVWLAGSYLRVLLECRGVTRPVPFRLPRSFAIVGLVMVALNGCCPWVGLKTQTSFAMFSNLRTEFAPNHLFLQRVSLFGYQDDIVEVVAAEPDILAPPKNPKSIGQFANPGAILPFFEVRRLLAEFPDDVSVTLRRDEQLLHYQKSGDQIVTDFDCPPPSFFERKFLWFRRHQHWSGPMEFTH